MSQELREARARIGEAIAIIDKILGTGPGVTPRGGSTDGARMVQRNGKNYVEIDNRNWFLETCQMLRVHPNAEPRDAEAFESLPSGLNKYGSLTEGQWRLFKALHNKLLGTWPEVPAETSAPVSTAIPDDLSEIPF